MDIENQCIYLLHGFASAPKFPSEKAAVLERVFDLPVKQLAYDSAGSYQDNFSALKRQVDVCPRFFVGTSLGAFYASKLAEAFHQQAAMPIMLNPCHHPATVLQGSKGVNVNFVTSAINAINGKLNSPIHKDDGSDYGVTVPDLPGWYSAGASIDEALGEAREAMLADGEAWPIARPVEEHQANAGYAGGMWAIVTIDPSKVEGKARRINITIPENLLNRINAVAKEQGESRSGFLVNAAMDQIGMRASQV